MRFVTVLLTLCVIAALVGGCASMSGGGGRAAEVMAAMAEYEKAQKAGDVDGLVAFFSEDWESAEGAGKEVLQGYFQGLVDQGGSEETVINLSECEVVFQGGIATMGPIIFESSAGESQWEYEMQKEADGKWRCIYSEQLY